MNKTYDKLSGTMKAHNGSSVNHNHYAFDRGTTRHSYIFDSKPEEDWSTLTMISAVALFSLIVSTMILWS